ncbi:MAG: hypothetical protein JW862_08975 [Anaerolineales bacterium]|nr:hypothetical protein [Anaerolineales bacterium]
MPTPFYHLSIAQELLTHPDLPVGLRQRFERHLPAFALGHTAPDVQTVSGQARLLTHFFRVPILAGAKPPWEIMLMEYPEMMAALGQDSAQAAFLAGYLCHLQADWFWVRQIYEPCFGPAARHGEFYQRQYIHNVLRSYLDFQILGSLNGTLSAALAQAQPVDWLPFTADADLRKWRDFLAEQFRPGARIRTVDVFAARQGIAPEKYYELIESEVEMDRQVFVYLPRHDLAAYRQELLVENLRLCQSCFEPISGG